MRISMPAGIFKDFQFCVKIGAFEDVRAVVEKPLQLTLWTRPGVQLLSKISQMPNKAALTVVF